MFVNNKTIFSSFKFLPVITLCSTNSHNTPNQDVTFHHYYFPTKFLVIYQFVSIFHCISHIIHVLPNEVKGIEMCDVNSWYSLSFTWYFRHQHTERTFLSFTSSDNVKNLFMFIFCGNMRNSQTSVSIVRHRLKCNSTNAWNIDFMD